MRRTTIDQLVEEAKGVISGELANGQLFIIRLCEALALPAPDFAREDDSDNHYVFEKLVSFGALNGRQRLGRIDLFKRGCFVLETKQSTLARWRDQAGRRDPTLRGALAWRRAMTAARMQAEHYARALPEPPPFLIILDIGRVIELYADFSGAGTGYAPFPDGGRHRIFMEDLRLPEIQRRLRLVWSNPRLLAAEMRVAPEPGDDALTRYLLDRSAAGARRRPVPPRAGERFAPCLDLRARDRGGRILV